MSIVAASQEVWPDRVEDGHFIGELCLDGTTRQTKWILPTAARAREEGFERVSGPEANVTETALLPDVDLILVRDSAQLVGHLTDLSQIPAMIHDAESFSQDCAVCGADFADIMGQEHVKRAMEVAAAGEHNVFMLWPKSGNVLSPSTATATVV